MKKVDDVKMRKRFMSFMAINSFLILVWTVYIFAVQLLDPHDFEKRRHVRYTPTKELDIPIRGYIYDRNFELLARTIRFFQIDYDRSQLKQENRNNDYRSIATIISDNSTLSYNYVYGRLANTPGNSSVYISDRIRETDLITIQRELTQKGYHQGLISEFSFLQRVYPYENLAARVLGAVKETRDTGSSSLSNMEGLSGIENTYDKELRGTYGWQKRLFDGRNNPIFIPNLGKQRVSDGNNIILTIDSKIQEIVEMNLREGLVEFGAKNAIGLFMNPKTGEIVAMASISVNDKSTNSQAIRALPNLATSFMFEPGSTIKPFTALAALEKNLFSTDDILDCRRYVTRGRTIRDSHPFEDLSFRDVIVHSSNVGTSKIADKLGSEALYKTLISFGFGNRTGSDIYGESAGLLRNLRDWQGFSLHSISFGQEMSVTPLQLTTAYATLANNGIMMRPYIVKAIIDDQNRTIKEYKPQRIRTVSKKAALDTLHTIMQDTVEYGTAKATKLPYITIAGKTGTAEKQAAGSIGYTRNTYIANFAGFFPVEDPQLAGVIIYDEPTYRYRYASMSAVVTFRKITEQILSLPDCQIMPSARMTDRKFVSMPSVIGSKKEEALQLLTKQSISYQFLGDTNGQELWVVNQFPKEGVEFDINQRVILVLESTENNTHDEATPKFNQQMPQLVGLTLRQAIQKAKQNNVHLVVDGIGKIVTQSIPVGNSITYGDECLVRAN